MSGDHARRLRTIFINTLGEIETALHSVDGIAAAACLFDRNRDRIVCIYEG